MKLITDPDLVGIWNDLLNNAFCTSMGTTGPKDTGTAALLRGFTAYMVASISLWAFCDNPA